MFKATGTGTCITNAGIPPNGYLFSPQPAPFVLAWSKYCVQFGRDPSWINVLNARPAHGRFRGELWKPDPGALTEFSLVKTLKCPPVVRAEHLLDYYYCCSVSFFPTRVR